jgi:hypothetical protein
MEEIKKWTEIYVIFTPFTLKDVVLYGFHHIHSSHRLYTSAGASISHLEIEYYVRGVKFISFRKFTQ